MNTTHYCSQCDCYHTDVPCSSKFIVHACPACESSPCCCPDEEHTLEQEAYRANKREAEEREFRRVQAALHWYGQQQEKSKFTSDDSIRAHALGVQL